MSRSHESPRGRTLGAAAAALAGVLALSACGGNQHGASKTDLDTMPNYPVAAMEGVATSAAVLPAQAERTRAYVCNRIFVDLKVGQVIVRPIVDPETQRPLELSSLDADGPVFGQPWPRDVETNILKLDGSEDEDQILGPDNCSWQYVTTRTVHAKSQPNNDYTVLVDRDKTSDVQDGDTISLGGVGAIENGLVNYDLGLNTAHQLQDFLHKL